MECWENRLLKRLGYLGLTDPEAEQVAATTNHDTPTITKQYEGANCNSFITYHYYLTNSSTLSKPLPVTWSCSALAGARPRYLPGAEKIFTAPRPSVPPDLLVTWLCLQDLLVTLQTLDFHGGCLSDTSWKTKKSHKYEENSWRTSQKSQDRRCFVGLDFVQAVAPAFPASAALP